MPPMDTDCPKCRDKLEQGFIPEKSAEGTYTTLWAEGEEPGQTDNPDILVAKRQAIDPATVEAGVDRLVAAAADGVRDILWRELLALVPDFQGLTGREAEEPPELPGALDAVEP